MVQYNDSQIGPLDDEGETPSTNTSNDQRLLEYAIQDFNKHHKDKYVYLHSFGFGLAPRLFTFNN